VRGREGVCESVRARETGPLAARTAFLLEVWGMGFRGFGLGRIGQAGRESESERERERPERDNRLRALRGGRWHLGDFGPRARNLLYLSSR